MLFNSIEFILIFLPVTISLFYIASYILKPFAVKSLLLFILTAASLAFYSYWHWPNIFVLLGSIFANYFLGKQFAREISHSKKKIWAIIGVIANLAVLGYFKYFNFFIENISVLTGNDAGIETIILPLGISFFTFQQIAYLVDSYKRKIEQHSFIEYAMFVSFFPQLIAGPIVLFNDVNKQYRSKSFGHFNIEYFTVGVIIFTIGLAKKVIIADRLSLVSQPVFTNADNGLKLQFFEAWGGSLAYTYQLYFDFSGYSDMAIGIALLIGIKLPVNFNSPYKATSIIEFWRRWHITLSNFLRDYLYVPMGGSRNGTTSTVRNLVIVMILGGLWHGAGWTFVVWGLLHGVYLAVNHLYRTTKPAVLNFLSITPLSYTLTLFCIVVSWVFFRAETFNGAYSILRAMTGENGIMVPGELYVHLPELIQNVVLSENEKTLTFWSGDITWDAFPFLILVGLLTLLAPSATDFYKMFSCHEKIKAAPLKYSLALYSGTMFVVSLLLIYTNSASEFLYFQF